MSESTIRASIKALLLTVPGIGKVNDYTRWSSELPALKAMFKLNPADKDAALHGWEITRDAVPSVTRLAKDKYKWVHSYSIKGYYAWNDSAASETLLQLVVDAIIKKFIDSRLANTEGHSLPAAQIAPFSLANAILCHRAELKLAVTEIVSATPEADQDLLTIKLGQYLAPETTWAMWTPATAFALDAIVVPTVPTGHTYKCTVPGISGVAEPAWPVGPAGVIVDGTATWTEDGAVIAARADIAI